MRRINVLHCPDEATASRQLGDHIGPAERREDVAQGDRVDMQLRLHCGTYDGQARPVRVVDGSRGKQHERDEIAYMAATGGSGFLLTTNRGAFQRLTIAARGLHFRPATS